MIFVWKVFVFILSYTVSIAMWYWLDLGLSIYAREHFVAPPVNHILYVLQSNEHLSGISDCQESTMYYTALSNSTGSLSVATQFRDLILTSKNLNSSEELSPPQGIRHKTPLADITNFCTNDAFQTQLKSEI